MRIAVASGKGGTGKTTVALALAQAGGARAALVDLDVEEPNAHLFLDLRIEQSRAVRVPVPVLDEARCDHCGLCARSCQFNAMACVGDKTLIFPDLCHNCGVCAHVCPRGAIREELFEIGRIESGHAGDLIFVQGRLEVGHASATVTIESTKAIETGREWNVLDCPPGTACPMVAAVREADFVVLVTEPTPFGLHDLGLAVDTLRLLGLPFGVVINRSDSGDVGVENYCRDEAIPVLARLPQSRLVAEGYARGETLLETMPHWRPRFAALLERVAARARGVAA